MPVSTPSHVITVASANEDCACAGTAMPSSTAPIVNARAHRAILSPWSEWEEIRRQAADFWLTEGWILVICGGMGRGCERYDGSRPLPSMPMNAPGEGPPGAFMGMAW